VGEELGVEKKEKKKKRRRRKHVANSFMLVCNIICAQQKAKKNLL